MVFIRPSWDASIVSVPTQQYVELVFFLSRTKQNWDGWLGQPDLSRQDFAPPASSRNSSVAAANPLATGPMLSAPKDNFTVNNSSTVVPHFRLETKGRYTGFGQAVKSSADFVQKARQVWGPLATAKVTVIRPQTGPPEKGRNREVGGGGKGEECETGTGKHCSQLPRTWYYCSTEYYFPLPAGANKCLPHLRAKGQKTRLTKSHLCFSRCIFRTIGLF